MKRFIIALAIASFCIPTHAYCQPIPCGGITIETIEPFPQTGAYNYFGIKVTLGAVQDKNITVQGYIYEQGDPNTNNPFSVTVYQGYTTDETSVYFYQTGPTSTATLTVTSTTPSPCYNDPGYFDAKFYTAGQFHNGFMANTVFNFTVPGSGVDYDSAVNLLKLFNKNYFTANEYSYFGSTQSSIVTDQLFEDFKYFVNYDLTKANALASSGPYSLNTADDIVDTLSVVDAANRQLFYRITSVLRQNLSGSISNSVLKDSFMVLENAWLDINEYNESAQGADLTGYILTIGTQSALFWEEYVDSLYDEGMSFVGVFPPSYGGGPNVQAGQKEYFVLNVVGLDATGAVIGALFNIGNQLLTGSGPMNWRSVGVSAVTVGIAGSTGLIGRTWKWLKSLW